MEEKEQCILDSNEDKVNLGKFKSVEALLQAYIALEAEFTRRSQRLKVLEEKEKTLQCLNEDVDRQFSNQMNTSGYEDMQTGAIAQSIPVKSKSMQEIAMSPHIQDVITKAVQNYMQNQYAVSAPPILKEFGSYTSMPKQKISTIEEAGRLAEQFFKKQNY